MDEGVSPASSTAYSLYMDRLEKTVKTELVNAPVLLHTNVCLLSRRLSFLFSADDIVLLTPSINQMHVLF